MSVVIKRVGQILPLASVHHHGLLIIPKHTDWLHQSVSSSNTLACGGRSSNMAAI